MSYFCSNCEGRLPMTITIYNIVLVREDEWEYVAGEIPLYEVRKKNSYIICPHCLKDTSILTMEELDEYSYMNRLKAKVDKLEGEDEIKNPFIKFVDKA